MQALPLSYSVPTDSILRRHFEQLASTAGLPQAPQDSILLRHYKQLLDARLEQAPERPVAKAAAPQAQAAPQSAARPVAQAAAAPTPTHDPSARAVASMPDRNPPAAAPTSWFSRLLARIFGN